MAEEKEIIPPIFVKNYYKPITALEEDENNQLKLYSYQPFEKKEKDDDIN